MADGSVKIDVILDDSKISGGVKKVEGRLSGIGDTARRGIATVGKLAGALGLVGLAYKGIDMVKQSLDGAIDRYDTLNNFPRVMEQIGFDAETSQRAIDKLSDGIQGLPTRLDEVASTAQNIAIMTGDLDGAVDTTLALNNAFLASGASTADAERGLQQYVQMLSKGEVDLQSWRTLQETMPYALRETAAAFGYTGESATNDFYDALKNGDITMSEFNDKLIELDTAQGGFADTAQEASAGIKTAWTNMKTWMVMGVADILEAIDEVLGGTGSIEGAINNLKPIVQGAFKFVADRIRDVGNVIEFVKGKFDEYKPTIDNVKNAMEPLISAFENTVSIVKGQFAPIWESLKTLMSSLMPIIQMVATIVGSVLVVALMTATSTLSGLARAVGPIINAFLNLVDVVVNVVNSIIAVLTGDFEQALEFWNNAVESSIEFFKSLWDGVVGFIAGFVETIIGWFEFLYIVLVGNSIIPDMVNAIIEWFNNLFEWLVEIVTMLVDWIVEAFTAIYETITNYFEMASEIIASVWEYIQETFSNALSFLVALVTGDFEGMKEAIQNQMENAQNLLENIWNAIDGFLSKTLGNIWTNIKSKFTDIKNNISNRISEAKNALVTNFNEMVSTAISKASEIVSTAREKFEEVKGAIRDKLTDAVSTVGEKVGEMPGKVTEKVSDMLSVGEDLIGGLIDGIKNMGKDAIEAVTGVVDGVIGKAKSLLKISSPSKLFEQFGKWTGEGLVDGIDGMVKKAEGASEKLSKGVVGGFDAEVSLPNIGRLKGLSVNSVIGGLLPSTINNGSSKPSTENKYNTINMDGLFNGAIFNVRDDNDIPKLAKELNDYIKQGARRNGVIF